MVDIKMFFKHFRCVKSLKNSVILLLLCVNHLDSGHCESCGYDTSCPALANGVLNVHIVPHTHNDVGWVATADAYYYGGVKDILDSVVKELLVNPARRFIYVETFFFWKWWTDCDEEVRNVVRTLVKEGRLQFAGGAWSMNDEAAAHYQSIIDQFTLGLSKLNKTFGKCGMPRVGWQIDPFGHSREFASLMAAMGYEGLFLGRIDYQDQALRLRNKNMEMLWRGNDDLGRSSDIFTGVLYDNYSPPRDFCFDSECGDNKMNNSDRFNKVSQFIAISKEISEAYNTKNILLTMGGDFHYKNAALWFTNLDILIKYTNQRAKKKHIPIRLMYSTPYCYLKAIKDASPRLPIKQDDFFPYANGPFSYWTGYYTSRPTTKYLEREANSYLQMAKQLQVLGNLKQKNMHVLEQLKSAVGIMQHHDAISGTEQQHVSDDYVRMLDRAIEGSLVIPEETFNKFIQRNTDETSLFKFNRCRLNESSCSTSENNQQFVVTVYNHLGWHVNTSVRIPVRFGSYSVYAPSSGAEIENQVVDIPQAVIEIPTRNSIATHEVVFIADLDPLSYKSFYILNRHPRQPENRKKNKAVEGLTSLVQHIRLGLNECSGEIFKAVFPDSTESNLKIKFYYYSSKYHEYQTNRPGAYMMRPEDTPHQTDLKYFQGPIGSVVKELRSSSSDSVSSTIRLYKGLNYIEHDWVVGPIPDKKSREYIVRYITDIFNEGEFYTDSNGRQMLKRKKNQRPQWNVTIQELVAGNYYPVTNQIFIQDEEIKATVLIDRSEGGTSLHKGHIELMLHRRIFTDDDFGVGEPLNEIVDEKGLVARGTQRLYISKVNDEDVRMKEKRNVFEFHLKPQVLISETDMRVNDWLTLDNSYSWMHPLPLGLHLLTLEPWGRNKLLLRLENYLELSDPKKSPISINLRMIFRTIKVDSFKETTLAANYWVDENERWKWNIKQPFVKNFNNDYGELRSFLADVTGDMETKQKDEGFTVWIRAKEIRTFVVNFRHARYGNSRRDQKTGQVIRKKSVGGKQKDITQNTITRKNITKNTIIRRFISRNSCNHGGSTPRGMSDDDRLVQGVWDRLAKN